MRAYTVATTAVTIGVTRKWVDNVLSHHMVLGVLQERQGIVRRVTPTGLMTLEISASLVRAMNIPIAQALEIAAHLIAMKGTEFQIPGALAIRISADIDAIGDELNVRLERAIEISPTPKRGRPRRK